jgi:hypothetical protein
MKQQALKGIIGEGSWEIYYMMGRRQAPKGKARYQKDLSPCLTKPSCATLPLIDASVSGAPGQHTFLVDSRPEMTQGRSQCK